MWISIEIALPSDGERVLTCDRNLFVDLLTFNKEAGLFERDEYSRDLSEIEYWMRVQVPIK